MAPPANREDTHLTHQTLSDLITQVGAARERLAQITSRLVRIPSETPPGDTRALASAVAEFLANVDGAETAIHCAEHPVDNVVSVLKGGGSGKRLILNGHLDTYPAGDRAAWSEDPFSGAIKEGRVFGRGAGDMKGGIACAIVAFESLARCRDAWAGELVLTFAGDEERMGELGTKYLLDTMPEAHGDAMLSADVGSPQVPRIGEKGMIWLDVFATGRAAHGAHVHRGKSAIDRLRQALDALENLRAHAVDMPEEARRTIDAAAPLSEPLGGAGEADVLKSITVNIGRIAGGETGNLVAAEAEASVDVRLPNGTTISAIEAEIRRLLKPIDGIRFDVTRRYEPSWTAPDEPIVTAVCTAGKEILGTEPQPNGRIGGSDARLYRAAGIPTVVCGPTPHNLGGPDEYVEIDELVSLAKIYTHAALSFLSGP